MFKNFLSIFSSILICSNFSYQYFADIDILKKSVDIPSIFQKMPIYRQSISIFHQKSMKKGPNLLKRQIFLPKMSLSISIFSKMNLSISISISIFSKMDLSISISISIFSKMSLSISISISIFSRMSLSILILILIFY